MLRFESANPPISTTPAWGKDDAHTDGLIGLRPSFNARKNAQAPPGAAKALANASRWLALRTNASHDEPFPRPNSSEDAMLTRSSINPARWMPPGCSVALASSIDTS
jgi:hypothetical protein